MIKGYGTETICTCKCSLYIKSLDKLQVVIVIARFKVSDVHFIFFHAYVCMHEVDVLYIPIPA